MSIIQLITSVNLVGVWEFPLNSHFTESFEGGYCPYLDQCVLLNLDENDVLQWLQEDFSRYYDGNRAPYLMAFHTSWFQQKNLVSGLQKFMDWLLTQYLLKRSHSRVVCSNC
jgi:hypothetical protein